MEASLEIKQQEDGSPRLTTEQAALFAPDSREAVKASLWPRPFWAWRPPGVFTVEGSRSQLWEGVTGPIPPLSLGEFFPKNFSTPLY